ncbi:MAG: anaerobic sulfatase-maturation protein [Chloroflexota bacterium]
MAKPVGATCNLACEYCYYLGKANLSATRHESKMSDSLLELYTRQYLRSQQGGRASMVWHGGEPMLRGIAFFKRAVDLQSRYAGGRQVENSLQTNGLLVDDEWCHFFRENRFLVGLSIDGPEHIHDRYRRGRIGHASFSAAMRAMKLFQKHGVEFNVLSTINDYSSQYPLEIYRFFKAQGVRFIQFIPVVECVSHTSTGQRPRLLPPAERDESLVSPWSVKPEDYGRFLTTVFDEWVVQDVGRYFVQLFDALLGNWCGTVPSVCVMARECGGAAVLEHDGSVYSCDHYVFPEYRLGNIRQHSINELIRSDRQKRFGRQKHERLTSTCRRCEYLSLCYGECPRNRFALSPSGERGHNYLCAGLKQFFQHTEPYMRFMRRELMSNRPAANVMDWAATPGDRWIRGKNPT